MLKVFLSYASEDRALVQPYYRRFEAFGAEPWMDVEKLLPGQQWEGAIEKAFREAHVVVLFLSPRSVSKRGFVQREANEAIQNLRLKKPDDIYVIPLLLEPCEVPYQIANALQYVDLSSATAWQSVVKSLAMAAEQLEIVLKAGEEHGPYRVFMESMKERQNGKPGHDLDIQYPRVVCVAKPKVADQLSALFAGRVSAVAAKIRSKPWVQYPDWSEDPDDAGDDVAEFSWNREGRWDSFKVEHASDTFFSLSYTVSWYGARAAHPNHLFETYNFGVIGDSIVRVDLAEFFTDSKAALNVIAEACKRGIEREFWKRTGQRDPEEADLKWIASGCSPELTDAFEAFAVDRDGFTFFFAPYEVSAYALGSWTVKVSFYELRDLLSPSGPYSLLMEGL
jgi:hypothetical protein